MWIARNQDNSLFLFNKKPSKNSRRKRWLPLNINFTEIDSSLFPEVKWTDKEPTEIELVIKK